MLWGQAQEDSDKILPSRWLIVRIRLRDWHKKIEIGCWCRNCGLVANISGRLTLGFAVHLVFFSYGEQRLTGMVCYVRSRAVTRGVNKVVKEDLKMALERQVNTCRSSAIFRGHTRGQPRHGGGVWYPLVLLCCVSGRVRWLAVWTRWWRRTWRWRSSGRCRAATSTWPRCSGRSSSTKPNCCSWTSAPRDQRANCEQLADGGSG